MELFALILIVHTGVSVFMTGLIWFVQIVHYPLLHKIGKKAFQEYEKSHCRMTTFVVGPAMFIELCTALVLILPNLQKAAVSNIFLLWINIALLTLIWLSTAFLQMPDHMRLERQGYDELTVNRLVLYNWLRTLLWSVRSIVLLYYLTDLLY